ncbi:MAG: hypothetical protein ACSLFP_01605 [Acidimicrobiales bacterium]
MRIVVCDEDLLMTELIESLVARTGHEVVGVAADTASAVHLIEAARPEAVILDLSLGYNTDFDVIASAQGVGARAIVFSRNAESDRLSHYAVAPAIVPKPDLTALEHLLGRLEIDEQHNAVEHERRTRPTRAASGPEPMGISDTQAFFEAVNGARAGDALVSVDGEGTGSLAEVVLELLRSSDRLLAFPGGVRCYLPGGGDEAIPSLLGRIAEVAALPPGAKATAVVVADGEDGADAFDRLRHHGDEIPLP